jgi:hypothetical protein
MRMASLILAVAALPALADVKTPSGKVIDCYCTDRSGGRIELGEYICLQVDGRMFTAQCQMSLNVPMWREIRNGCLSSRLESRNPALDAGPVHPGI